MSPRVPLLFLTAVGACDSQLTCVFSFSKCCSMPIMYASSGSSSSDSDSLCNNEIIQFKWKFHSKIKKKTLQIQKWISCIPEPVGWLMGCLVPEYMPNRVFALHHHQNILFDCCRITNVCLLFFWFLYVVKLKCLFVCYKHEIVFDLGSLLVLSFGFAFAQRILWWASKLCNWIHRWVSMFW